MLWVFLQKNYLSDSLLYHDPITVIDLNFFIPCTWPNAIQWQTAFLCLKSTRFSGYDRINHCKLKRTGSHHNDVFLYHINLISFQHIMLKTEPPHRSFLQVFCWAHLKFIVEASFISCIDATISCIFPLLSQIAPPSSSTFPLISFALFEFCSTCSETPATVAVSSSSTAARLVAPSTRSF